MFCVSPPGGVTYRSRYASSAAYADALEDVIGLNMFLLATEVLAVAISPVEVATLSGLEKAGQSIKLKRKSGNSGSRRIRDGVSSTENIDKFSHTTRDSRKDANKKLETSSKKVARN